MAETFSDAECGLLLEIERAPSDDAPRLVYADWLTERGEPELAELIVVQCALAGRDLDRERRSTLMSRQSATVRDAEKRWIARLGLPALSCTLERGLPGRLEMRGLDFVGCDFKIPADVLLPELVLRFHEADSLPKLVDHVQLALEAPNLDRVRRLDLSGIRFANQPAGDVLAKILGRAQRMVSVRTLALRAAGLTDEGAKALAGAATLRGLVRLDLEANELGSVGAGALVASPSLQGLQELRLGSNLIGETALETLQAAFGPRLKLGTQFRSFRSRR